MFDAPKNREITQGTIFSCAHSENYNCLDVLGLVITARCDVARDKTPVFNYVPVVSLNEWLFVDGAAIALDRVEADCINTLKSLLKATQLSDSLLRTHEPQAIYDVHFLPKAAERNFKTTCDKFLAAVARLVETRNLMENQLDRERFRTLLGSSEALVDGLLKELASHRLSGYYLLRDLETFAGQKGNYVALLREVHHIPSAVARQIAVGVEASDWDIKTGICPKFLNQDDIALPVAKLRSPWIEHLMQNFSMLFSRIGVTDNNFDEIKKSVSSLNW
ncbi:hypothetical protein [Polaromonas sp. SM01]|uniref:hypothetical protein n=1 Tax=Polaromonas sp. SM01 TaxID=3085630 RepID=UPI0029828D46|nr:hypothetical protein [Polaromonas sp. SM01]MDW5444836.1 hypothetical protein [Polaromonas sp. SM01]